MKNNIIILKDGDTFCVIAKVEPSVSDPGHEHPAVSQAYRVVANSSGPTLVLVSLSSGPVRITELQRQDLERRGDW